MIADMKKIFGKIDTRGAREEKDNEKAHSSFIGKKYVIGKHTVVVEVRERSVHYDSIQNVVIVATNSAVYLLIFVSDVVTAKKLTT